MPDKAPEITKRRVTMKRAVVAADGFTYQYEATDYVLPEDIEAYTADARTRWDYVAVSDEPDAGPGGYDGETRTFSGELRPATGETTHSAETTED
jgi:hypothetical protein